MPRWQLHLLGAARLSGAQDSEALERRVAVLLTYLTLEGATPRARLAGPLAFLRDPTDDEIGSEDEGEERPDRR